MNPAILQTLPHGLRLLLLPLPGRQALHASVFIHAGSAHEEPAWPGLAHVAEHMVFKGSERHSAEQLNLLAEERGADFNAHTDRDHTAFHLRGLAEDAPLFIDLLAELVLEPRFPPEEIERERQVLLQEFAEVEDDPVATAYTLMDAACWHGHALARPVIGRRRTLERFDRAALQRHVSSLYTAPRMVVALAGDFDAALAQRQVEAAFAGAPAQDRGPPPLTPAPRLGGLSARAQAGSSQTHMVMGFGLPGLEAPDAALSLAATVLGEGMSSPLLAELRERRGLAYHASAHVDLMEAGGQFVVEASMAPEHALAALQATLALLTRHAQGVQAQALARAKRQWAVRQTLDLDNPARRLEQAAVHTLVQGAPPDWARLREEVMALTPTALRQGFERLCATPLALAFTGQMGRRLKPEAAAAVAAQGLVFERESRASASPPAASAAASAGSARSAGG